MNTKTCFKDYGTFIVPKRPYETREEAVKDAYAINDLPTQIHKAVPFKCSKCKKYHLYRPEKS